MAPENEHKEEYNKPWEVWAYEKCRECFHFKYMHLFTIPTGFTAMKKPSGIVGACQQILDGGGFCSCIEYEPSDNLNYIELLAKKKGIIPEDNE